MKLEITHSRTCSARFARLADIEQGHLHLHRTVIHDASSRGHGLQVATRTQPLSENLGPMPEHPSVWNLMGVLKG